MIISKLADLRRAYESKPEAPFVLEVKREKEGETQIVHPFCYITRVDIRKGIYFSQVPQSQVNYGKINSGFIDSMKIMDFDQITDDQYEPIPVKEYIQTELVRNQEGMFVAKNWNRTRLTLTLERGSEKTVVNTYQPVGYFFGLIPINLGERTKYTAALTVLPKGETDIKELLSDQRKKRLTLDYVVKHMFDGLTIEKAHSKFDEKE
jgi:hypothetical protein